MTPIVATVGPLAAASANNIALSQTPTTGALTLNGALVAGGVAILDTPRRVLITTTGNESSRTFTVTGTDVAGMPQSESVTGPNVSTGYTVLDYATVTSITISGNAANALTVGTNGIASSPWVRMDPWAAPNISVQCVVTGTVNYTLQQSLDDPNAASGSVAASSCTWGTAQINGATATAQVNLSFTPAWLRVLLNSGTGSVRATIAQNNVVSR